MALIRSTVQVWIVSAVVVVVGLAPFGLRAPKPTSKQQLPMDPRRAPEWVRDGHLRDQASDLSAGRGRPPRGRDRRVQYHAKARRCNATTVAGRTTIKADFQSRHAARSPTQNSRSDQRTVDFGRGADREPTAAERQVLESQMRCRLARTISSRTTRMIQATIGSA